MIVGTEQTETPSRVVVALNGETASDFALLAAARHAARQSAILTGLFVREANFLSAAKLPFTSLVSYQTGAVLQLDEAGLSRAMRARARQLKERLEQVARAHDIQWEFESVEGNIADQILMHATNCSLLVLGRTSRRREPDVRRSVLTRVMTEARCDVVVVDQHYGRHPANAAMVWAGEPELIKFAAQVMQGDSDIISLLPIEDGKPEALSDLPRLLQERVKVLPGSRADAGCIAYALRALSPLTVIVSRQTLARLGMSGYQFLRHNANIVSLIVVGAQPSSSAQLPD